MVCIRKRVLKIQNYHPKSDILPQDTLNGHLTFLILLKTSIKDTKTFNIIILEGVGDNSFIMNLITLRFVGAPHLLQP